MCSGGISFLTRKNLLDEFSRYTLYCYFYHILDCHHYLKYSNLLKGTVSLILRCHIHTGTMDHVPICIEILITGPISQLDKNCLVISAI